MEALEWCIALCFPSCAAPPAATHPRAAHCGGMLPNPPSQATSRPRCAPSVPATTPTSRWGCWEAVLPVGLASTVQRAAASGFHTSAGPAPQHTHSRSRVLAGAPLPAGAGACGPAAAAGALGGQGEAQAVLNFPWVLAPVNKTPSGSQSRLAEQR